MDIAEKLRFVEPITARSSHLKNELRKLESPAAADDEQPYHNNNNDRTVSLQTTPPNRSPKSSPTKTSSFCAAKHTVEKLPGKEEAHTLGNTGDRTEPSSSTKNAAVSSENTIGDCSSDGDRALRSDSTNAGIDPHAVGEAVGGGEGDHRGKPRARRRRYRPVQRGYLPVCRASDPICPILRIPPEEGHVFKTKARAPTLITCEIFVPVVAAAATPAPARGNGAYDLVLSPTSSTAGADFEDSGGAHHDGLCSATDKSICSLLSLTSLLPSSTPPSALLTAGEPLESLEDYHHHHHRYDQQQEEQGTDPLVDAAAGKLTIVGQSDAQQQPKGRWPLLLPTSLSPPSSPSAPISDLTSLTPGPEKSDDDGARSCKEQGGGMAPPPLIRVSPGSLSADSGVTEGPASTESSSKVLGAAAGVGREHGGWGEGGAVTAAMLPPVGKRGKDIREEGVTSAGSARDSFRRDSFRRHASFASEREEVEEIIGTQAGVFFSFCFCLIVQHMTKLTKMCGENFRSYLFAS